MAQPALGTLNAQAQAHIAALLKTSASHEQLAALDNLIQLVKSAQASLADSAASEATTRWAEKLAVSAVGLLLAEPRPVPRDPDEVALRCGQLAALGLGANLWRAVFGPLREAGRSSDVRARLLWALEALVAAADPGRLEAQCAPLAVNLLAALEHGTLPGALLGPAARTMAALARAAPVRFAQAHLDDAADVLLAHALDTALGPAPLAAILDALAALGPAAAVRPALILDLCDKLAADLATAAPSAAPRFLLAYVALLQGLAPLRPAETSPLPRVLVRALVQAYDHLPAWPAAAPWLAASNRAVLLLLTEPTTSAALLEDALQLFLLAQLRPASHGAHVPPAPALIHALTAASAALRLLPPLDPARSAIWLPPLIAAVERAAFSHVGNSVRAHGVALLRSLVRLLPDQVTPALEQRLQKQLPASEPPTRVHAHEARIVQTVAALSGTINVPQRTRLASKWQARPQQSGEGRGAWLLGRPVRQGAPATAQALVAALMRLQTHPPPEAGPLLQRILAPDAAPALRLAGLVWLHAVRDPTLLTDSLLTALLTTFWAPDTRVVRATAGALASALALVGDRVPATLVARILAAALVRVRETELREASGLLLAAAASWVGRVPLEPAAFGSAADSVARGRSWRDEADAVLQLLVLLPAGRLPAMHGPQWTRSLQALVPAGDAAGPAAELVEALRRAGSGEVAVSLAREWLPAQLARFVVTHRLRTPAGGPAQTFEVLERLVSATAAQAPAHNGSLLLLLLARLEHDVRAAIDAAGPVAPGPTGQPHFFAANAKVCEEWFARLRVPALALAHAAGCAPDLHFHANARLAELMARGKQAELPAALAALADALVLLRFPAELRGLADWLQQLSAAEGLPSVASLLRALAEHAAGALEAALPALQTLATDNSLPAAVVALARAHAAHVGARLASWSSPTEKVEAAGTPLLRVRAALLTAPLNHIPALSSAGLPLALAWLPLLAPDPVAALHRPDVSEPEPLLRHLHQLEQSGAPVEQLAATARALARLACRQNNFCLSMAAVARLPSNYPRLRGLLEAQVLRTQDQLPAALTLLTHLANQPSQPLDVTPLALVVRSARWLRKSGGVLDAKATQQLQGLAETGAALEAAAAWGELVHMHARLARPRHVSLPTDLPPELAAVFGRHLDNRLPQPVRRREESLRADLARLGVPVDQFDSLVRTWQQIDQILAHQAEAAVQAAIRQEQLAPPPALHQELQHLRVLDLALQHGGTVAEVLLRALPGLPGSWAEAAQHVLPLCGRAEDPITEQTLKQVVLRAACAAPHLVLPAALPLLPEPSFAEVTAGLRGARGPELAELEALREALVPLAQLPEELWSNLLAHTHARVAAALRPLREDLAARDSAALPQRERRLRDRAALLLGPLVLQLRAQWDLSAGAATNAPHRRAFIRWFGPQLLTALASLTELAARLAPVANELDSLWSRSGMRELQRGLHVRQTSWAGRLGLQALAPSLAAARWHALQLPGRSGTAVRISRISSDIGVLASKTRPKRLLLLAADGTRHEWLLKGRDDLQLDAACVRLLAALDLALAHAARDVASPRAHIRYYAVLPLGAGAGLIQMLPQPCPSLLALVRRWKRHHWSPPAPEPALSADAFFAAVLPRLRAAGCAAAPRSEWPLTALADAHKALADSLPAAELLARELLLAAPAPAAWVARRRTFAQSLGASSAAGYVAGLGDRHLDNVLFDPGAGELAHIDFNVCLERGVRLRVPELVPFRLTRLLLGPLGVAGASQGDFQLALRGTLAAARASRELLLRLLAGHLHSSPALGDAAEPLGRDPDPLRERRGAELSAALNMLAARAADLLIGAQGHARLLQILRALGALLPPLLQAHHAATRLRDELGEARAAQANREARRQQLSQALQAASGAVVTTETAAASAAAGLAQCRRALEEAAGKCGRWQARHLRSLAGARALPLDALAVDMLRPLPATPLQPPTAGPGLVASAAALELQLRELLVAQQAGLTQLLPLLAAHCRELAVMEPHEAAASTGHAVWVQVLERLLHSPADSPPPPLSQLLAAVRAELARAPSLAAVLVEADAAAAETNRLARELAELDERYATAHLRVHALHSQLRSLPGPTLRSAVLTATHELLDGACATLAAQARADVTGAGTDEAPLATATQVLESVEALAAAGGGEWVDLRGEARGLLAEAVTGALNQLVAGLPPLLGAEVWRALESRDPSVSAAAAALAELARAPPAGLAAFLSRYQALLLQPAGGGALLLAGFDHFFLPAENALLRRALALGGAEDLARRLLEMKVASVAFVLEQLVRYHAVFEVQRAAAPLVACQAEAVAAAAFSAALTAYVAGYSAHALLPLLRARLPPLSAVTDEPDADRLAAEQLGALRDSRQLEDELRDSEHRLTTQTQDHARLALQLKRADLLQRGPDSASRLAALQAALDSLRAASPLLSTCLQQYTAVRSELAQELLLADSSLQQAVARARLVIDPDAETTRQERIQQILKVAEALLDLEAVRVTPEPSSKLQQLDNAHKELVALYQDAWLAQDQANSHLRLAQAEWQRCYQAQQADLAHHEAVLPLSELETRLTTLEHDLSKRVLEIRTTAIREAEACGISKDGRLPLFGGDDLALLLAPILASTATTHHRLYTLANRLTQLLARVEIRAKLLFSWLLDQQASSAVDSLSARLDRLITDLAQLAPVFERLVGSINHFLRLSRERHQSAARPRDLPAEEEEVAASQDEPFGKDESSSESDSEDEEDDNDIPLADELADDLEAQEISALLTEKRETRRAVLEVKGTEPVATQLERSMRVLRRLKARISGKDSLWASENPQPDKPELANALSVEEQAATLVRQATAVSNLARMYEGWTAWV